MIKPVLAALVALAAPASSWAQTGSSTHTPNQTNPQAMTNEKQQPANAHRVQRGPGSGQANSIPTPTISGSPMSKIPQAPGVPHSDAIR